MYIKDNYVFFKCYHCGEWFYSKNKIKTKKCWRCNRSFQVKNSLKFSKMCSGVEAIAIMKELKVKNRDFKSFNKSIYEKNST